MWECVLVKLSESVSVSVPTCERARESVSEIEQDSVRTREHGETRTWVIHTG